MISRLMIFFCHRLGLLAILLAAAIAHGSAAGQEPAEPVLPSELVLSSGSGTCVQIGTKTYQGLLARELLRQSLLLAAREELQLLVRDVTIGEATSADANWELACSAGNPNLLELLRGKSPTQVSVWQHPMQLPGESLRYDVLLAGMEIYSRSIFLRVLKEQLPAPMESPSAAKAIAMDPALLDEVFLVPQFAAVRQAHAQPREQQFDPQRLEALIRGYANLGMLSESYWHPAHIGYKARALLYAQRWVAHEPASARAVYCRAYAWTMTGVPALALADLEQAKKLSDGKVPAPSWAGMIQDAGQYKLTKLSTYPAGGPHFKMARLLSAVAASRANEPERAKHIALMQRRETLSPRLFEGWFELDRQDERNDIWEMASGHFGSSLYDHLSAVPDLPAKAQAIGKQQLEQTAPGGSAEELAARAALVTTLFAAEDAAPRAQPNNRALAEVIQQATFLHAWRGGIPVHDDAVYAPLADCLKLHPYASLLKNRTGEKIRQVIKNLNYDQLQIKDHQLFHLFPNIDQTAYQLTFDTAERHLDLTTLDKLYRMPYRHPKAAVKLDWNKSDVAKARAVLEIDPHHPFARAILVAADWKSVEAQASEWVETAAEHRSLAAALSLQFEKAGRLEDSEKLLLASLQIYDDLKNYRDLALFYSAVGKRAEWKKTWDEYLAKYPEDPERWYILASLAESMIRERNLPEAEKYGLEAARTGELAGLLAAASVYEIKENWDEAERHYRRAAEREVEREHEWYMFCRRVGKGDEVAAKELAERYFAEFTNRDRARRHPSGVSRADLLDFHMGGTFGAALGHPLEGLKLFQDQFNRTPDPALGLHAAFMAIELKQPETRDLLIKRIVEESPKYRSHDGDVSPFIVLAQDIQKDLKAGSGKTTIDLQAAREFARKQKMSDKRQTDFDYLLGRYYEICGNAAEAKEAYLHCLAQPTIRHNSRTLAGIGLRRLGGTPADYRDRLQLKTPDREAERE